MSIAIRDVTKSFGASRVLNDVSLTVPDGELVALLGPSGCGKTTLLRIIAGLESPESGEVAFAGSDADGDTHRVGFVFQHYALFRHMNVFENVAFGLRVRPRAVRPSNREIEQRVSELLHLVQLDEFAKHKPQQLSGGQRQRVALARALAVQPRVLLLDEPFGALDARVRVDLRRWLRRLHDDIRLTSVFVTHDQEEALEVADRVVVMNAGRIEQIGTADEVFHHPASEFVLNFLGSVNTFRGRVVGGRPVFGDVTADAPPVRISFRPYEVDLSREPVAGRSLSATVLRVHSAGAVVRIQLAADSGEHVDAEVSRERAAELRVETGARVYVTPREVRVFAGE